ncbi:unnamed protein product [Camellia sinensis]
MFWRGKYLCKICQALSPHMPLGDRILDMCAAPGGKHNCNCYPYEGQMRGCCMVLDIQKLAAEMGLNCITTYKLDALKAVHRRDESSYQWTSNQMTYTSKAELRKSIPTQGNRVGRNHGIGGRVEKSEGFSPNSFDRVQKSEGFSPNSFDRVLLDAPCSALGLRPRLFAGEVWYQRKMFDQAVQVVRSGGVLGCSDSSLGWSFCVFHESCIRGIDEGFLNGALHHAFSHYQEKLGEAEKAMYHYKQAGAESDPDVMASKTKIYIVLEYVGEGKLFDKIAKLGRHKEDEARRYCQQLINAVDYCHSRGMYHKDFKPENLLLDSFGVLKISDFGLSAFSQQVRTCTINPGENEALVRYALDTYKFLSLAVQHPKIGGPGPVGGCELSNGYIEEWLRPGEEDLVQRFDPSSLYQ